MGAAKGGSHEKKRIMAVAVLIVGSSLAVSLSQQPGVKRTDRATAPTAGSTHGAPLRETVTLAADEPIPNLPGKRLVALVVDYPPEGARPRTVTPVRLSSTPMSSRARLGAWSTASLPVSTGPVRRWHNWEAPDGRSRLPLMPSHEVSGVVAAAISDGGVATLIGKFLGAQHGALRAADGRSGARDDSVIRQDVRGLPLGSRRRG
jgi:hypothetical protein